MANEFKIKNGYLSEGNSQITGSLNVSSGITGSLFGTASFAITASHALNLSPTATASYATQALSASYATTASYVQNAQSASYVLQAVSASYATNGGVTKILAGANVNLSPVSGLGDVTITSFGTNLYNTATGSYGSFYDTGSVLATSATTVYSMSLNTTDISNGVFVSSSGGDNTRIKFTNAGTYNVQFSSQFSNTDNSTQDIIIWVRKNGVDIPDSSGVAATPPFKAGSNGQVLAAWNYYLNLSAGDFIQLCWHVEQANVITLETIPAGVGPTHPRTPSTILTAQRVDTFLSNTGSFSGSFTGTLTGTASYATNALSASWAPDTTFPYTGSAGITGSLDVVGDVTITGSLFVSQSLDTSARLLYDNSGINTSIDWENRWLKDISGAKTVDWQNKSLNDASSNVSIDWQNRTLLDLSNGTSIDWEGRTLSDSAFGEVLGYNVSNNGYTINSNTYYRTVLGSQVQEDFSSYPSGSSGKVNYEGEIIEGVLDGAVADHDLVYLDTNGTWYQLTQGTDECTKLLGICVNKGKQFILLEGSITVSSNIATIDSPYVQSLQAGLPIYIRDGGGTQMSTVSPPSTGQYIRVLGHAYYNSSTYTDYFIMKFRPANDWFINQ